MMFIKILKVRIKKKQFHFLIIQNFYVTLLDMKSDILAFVVAAVLNLFFEFIKISTILFRDKPSVILFSIYFCYYYLSKDKIINIHIN